nr:biotin--[acetyl-CoA-carboxylase] ligase [Candidatus Njordarchaeota archaeon]
MGSRKGEAGKRWREDVISVKAIKQGLHTKIFGSSITYFDQAGSANDEAKRIAEKAAGDGSVVVVGEQTSGRGRLGRQWYSPRGGVWMSIVLRPPSNRPLQKITLLSGLSVAETLRRLYRIDAVVKWPNDVLVKDKKICGALTEGSFRGDTPLFVIVGIGINANIGLENLPEELRHQTTSLKTLLHRKVSLNKLIRRLLTAMERNYELFINGKDKGLWLKYKRLCKTIGLEVRVESGEGEVYEGIAEGISPEGGLILRTKNGSELIILSGDCFHLRPKT